MARGGPRRPDWYDVGITDDDEQLLRFAWDMGGGTYRVDHYEFDERGQHWGHAVWPSVRAASIGEAVEATDVDSPRFVEPPKAVRWIDDLPPWVRPYMRPSNPSRKDRAAAIVRKHAKDRTWRQRIRGGARRVPADFTVAALRRGVEVELEHTNDPLVALEIAMDHLDEDPRYYVKLRRIHRENPEGADPDARALAKWAWCTPSTCGPTPPSGAARALANRRWTLPEREKRVRARILAV